MAAEMGQGSRIHPSDPGQGWTRPGVLTIFLFSASPGHPEVGSTGPKTCSLDLSMPIFLASPVGSLREREMINRTAAGAQRAGHRGLGTTSLCGAYISEPLSPFRELRGPTRGCPWEAKWISSTLRVYELQLGLWVWLSPWRLIPKGFFFS